MLHKSQVLQLKTVEYTRYSSGQTSIMFTPSKRKRPDPNIEGEDEMEDKIRTHRKKMKEGGKKPSSRGARTEGREDLTPATSNSVEHRPEKSRGFMRKEDKEPQKNTKGGASMKQMEDGRSPTPSPH